ncbi:MAG: PEP-CTERM/exosortase system-associated acyltransferase [Gammaproteobacteria bacterium]|nr:PEP-CTERM/exosortase system-associated acyltransferase [Gammaproteobacteria bacterium]
MCRETQLKHRLESEYFFIGVADDGQCLEDTYHLRYQVYCQETQFLPSENYPEHLETDRFDPNSIHIGSIHNSGEMAGTVRLVLPSNLGFPFMEHCELFPEYQYLNTQKHIPNHAEISRLAVSKLFRRRLGDGRYALSDAEQEKNAPLSLQESRRQATKSHPTIVFDLYRSLYQESKRMGVTHWFLAMEKGLNRLLKRMEYRFEPIGPEIDYYGPVTPYVADIGTIEQRVLEKKPSLFYHMMEGLEDKYLPEIAKSQNELMRP